MPISGDTRQRLATALTLEGAANEIVTQLDTPTQASSTITALTATTATITTLTQTNPGIEGSTNAITAFATGGQASAVALTKSINRVTVCATAGDSVKLPAAVAGKTITVLNQGAASLAIFPATGEVIDALSANASVSLPAAGTMVFTCALAGTWNSDLNPTQTITTLTSTAATITTLTLTNPIVSSATNAITAFAGGGQGSAVALTSSINRVTTVGTAADSVKLPAATAGKAVVVINAAAANAMNVFPQTGEIINALSANTAISVAANKVMVFYCAVAGTWNSLLTA